MKCPVCEKAGDRSRVYEGGTMTTAMGVSRYYDEDGHYVVDDPNTRTTSYQCGNGHRFTVDRYQGELTVNVLPE